MKFDADTMARLRAATQQLMQEGPLAATAAIQQALGGGMPSAFDDAVGKADEQPAMKDLNERPAYARGGKAPKEEATRPRPAPAAAPGIAEWLAKAGAKLPEGLRTGDLPGARKRRPPPPPLPDGAQFLDASFTGAAGTRPYKLYVPSTYRDNGESKGKPVPLVVMLHGCTQDPDDFAAGTRMNQLAEESGCLVVYPAQTQQANSSRCWNWFSAADQQRGRGEPEIVAGIARQVMARYAVDPDRVGIAGLSAGGAMAVVVGALYPELFKAVGVHSGLPFGAARDLPGALQAMKQAPAGRGGRGGPPLIVFHGDKDSTVHPGNGGAIVRDNVAPHGTARTEVIRGKSPGGRKYTRTIYRNGAGKLLAEHWELHGGGHAWAGGSASGSYTDGTGPDASREMLRFFAAVAAAD